MSVSDNAAARGILRYHRQTKHHYERYARSPGYMDWANQPNPFRSYAGVPTLPLPLLKVDPACPHPGLYEPLENPQAFGIEAVGGLLELSVGLSAWKVAGQSRWSLRMNPSSGNLHPTETHLVLPPLASQSAGVYHYNPLHHALERRAAVPAPLWRQLEDHFQGEGFLIGLTSIFWRESWKYGERAFRYCNHDVGHALAAIRLAANLFGWRATCLTGLSDEAVATILGLNRTAYAPLEEEHPDLLCRVGPWPRSPRSVDLPENLVNAFQNLAFQGDPNQLSPERTKWEIIAEAADLTRKPATSPSDHRAMPPASPRVLPSPLNAAEIIRKRRSATAFSRGGAVSRERFLAILDSTRPHDRRAPFDAGLGPPALSLILFVHRVHGLPPGAYAFIRDPRDTEPLRRRCRPEFLWKPPEPGFPLYLLEEGDHRRTATMISCHQDIAGDSVFSLGMLARFQETVEAAPYRYRHLFWESGMIGQILYLEAEACGLRGTGIGCYFDDALHELLGLKDAAYQSMYHFTVGEPIEDERLTTLPPYYHLERRKAEGA